MAQLKRWSHHPTLTQFGWKDSWMKMWATENNNCCPDWYAYGAIYGAKRPIWLNIFMWSALRNPVGGNPLHVYNVPRSKVRIWGSEVNPDVACTKEFLATGKRSWKWRFIQYGWRVGFWASYPWMRQHDKDPTDAFDVIDIQHGYKLHTTGNDDVVNLKFTPWDSGRRTN